MKSLILGVFLGVSYMLGASPKLDDMKQTVTDTNNEFYNELGVSFDKIPFESILPDLLVKYGVGQKILEIGSGTGALAFWLAGQGYQVSCIEPAEVLAQKAEERGLSVYSTTLQKFQIESQYDNVVAISSLIHIPKTDLPLQIQKVVSLLKPQGRFFVSFIEGENEGFEDPTKVGKLRFFAKWNEEELDSLLSPYFELLENHKIYVERMDRMFFLRVYALK